MKENKRGKFIQIVRGFEERKKYDVKRENESGKGKVGGESSERRKKLDRNETHFYKHKT